MTDCARRAMLDAVNRATVMAGKLCTALFICALFIPLIAAAADFPDSAALQHEMDRIREEHQIPGMAAAIVVDRTIAALAASGVRKHGSGVPVEPGDAFQIGSINKPITAALCHLLAQMRVLSTKRRLLDVFPEFRRTAVRAYRNVTVEMLLTHLAAFPYKPASEPSDEYRSISRDMRRRRREYVKAALRDQPAGPVGEHFVYSGGTIIAAAMLEQVTGRTWERLVRRYVFKPLGMHSAGFGAMSAPDAVTGVWEHQINDGVVTAVPAPLGYAQEVHAPAGRNVHVSAGDLARFMIAHFPYGTIAPRFLTRASVLAMQQKTRFSATSPGWFVRYDGWSDWKTIYHYGDNGKSIGALVFSPKYEAGYVILANISGDLAWEGVNELAGAIEEFFSRTLPTAAAPALGMAAGALSFGSTASASNIYHEMPEYGPARALDGSYRTRWATDEGVQEAWLEVDLGRVRQLSAILIKEEFSPRVTGFSLLVRNEPEETWQTVAAGQEIGEERIINLRHPHPARLVRLQLSASGGGGPTISEFQLFGKRLRSAY